MIIAVLLVTAGTSTWAQAACNDIHAASSGATTVHDTHVENKNTEDVNLAKAKHDCVCLASCHHPIPFHALHEKVSLTGLSHDSLLTDYNVVASWALLEGPYKPPQNS